ncbi:MAG TPA: hypothetical protein PKU97_02525 [Kofleriaceae bacterium]|nr:hypothetical protein [Kofleriaceae bacterium]
MRNFKISMAALMAVAAATGTAYAGGSPNTFGIGAEALFTNSDDNIGGISGNYDFGDFHLGGFLGVADPAGANNTRLEMGVRFYYHLHSSAMADFGVGGGLAYANTPVGGASDAKNDEVYLVPGMQIRAFISSNVALSFGAGIALGLGDADGVQLDGHLTSNAGVHYYFF